MKTEKIKVNFERDDNLCLQAIENTLNSYGEFLKKDESVELVSEPETKDELYVVVEVTAESSSEIDIILSDMFNGKDLITEVIK